jgi:hypothetical protein
MATYTHTFEVTGVGEFAYDMLRYDMCFPDRETDTSLMTMKHSRTLSVTQVWNTKNPVISPLRWASFGWNVDVNNIRTEKLDGR